MKKFSYTVWGKGADGQTFEAMGIVQDQDNIYSALNAAAQSTFIQVVRKEVKLGKPAAECCGPYTITAVKLEYIEEEKEK